MTRAPSLTPIVIGVLAHNEERRIAACLGSLPCGDKDIAVHVIVNGAHDRTAQIARGFAGVTVHDWEQGGKSRSWNRFVHDELDAGAGMAVFVDGDAEILPGSIAALAQTLADHPQANAASGMPANGRKRDHYRAMLVRDHGLFGDLYALRGSFVDRLRDRGIRLPDDCIGDDGLIGALAKTDLGNESRWDESRVMPCPEAGFLCEEVALTSPRSWLMQYRRMCSYSARHFQNRIISAIMRDDGAAGLPRALAALYPQWLDRLTPRRDLRWWWFDRLALARMRDQSDIAGA